MLGVIANTVAVLVGSSIGLLCRRGIPKKLTDAIMTAVGFCTMLIGIDGALEGQNILISIIAMVLGTLIGTLIDIDRLLTKLGDTISSRVKTDKKGGLSLSEGFVTSSLLFCVGAMTIVGSLNSGLLGDHDILFTKSLLDFISSIMLAASLGLGVMLSAVFVFVFQGAIALLAQYLAPVLNEAAIAEITCVGSLMIIALGLNLIGIGKFKVANFLPAIVIAPIAVWAADFISKLISRLI